ncbi:ceruloplasmin [Hyperolius riggenbachi]|uniref:ceruloplasmin n=1 Tax=Hyperolius riggenbachi TaxID=752182 RepID=UPI0035A30C92
MKLLAICLLCLLYVLCVVGKEREYFIGVREMNWDYAPSGKNIISGKSIEEDEQASIFLQGGPNRIGRVYKKAVYMQYTDGSYTTEIEKPAWLGLLGPIIRAEVGDVVIIHFKNFASRPYSLHPHGVHYSKENEGALYPDKTSGALKKDDAIKPGEKYTYKWSVVADHGPLKMDEDCILRVYHSHLDGPRDVYSGVVGPMIICKEGALDGIKKDTTKRTKQEKPEEFILMFSVIDENLSWYIDDNINTHTTPSLVNKEDEEFLESNKMHSINGYMFGNLPGISVCDDTHVRWYLFGMGNEVDVHSAYFHGQVLTHQHLRVDTISLFPATMTQSSMVTQNPGKWLLSCQVNDHLEGGMQAIYEVKNCTKQSHSRRATRVRHYYIAAEEIIWNYGPSSMNNFTGQKLDDPDSESATFFEQSDQRIGGSYKKAVYKEYMDGTFTKQKPKSEEEKHLGILGPPIVALVGDVVMVTFKNKASRPYSIQAHGVSYTKDMEGAVYNTGEDSKAKGQSEHSHASHVAPGDMVTYKWDIPNSVGNTLHDTNCLPWLYYSSVDVVRDTNSGLVGPLLVCRSLTKDYKQIGIAHDFFMMPTVFDENKSWYLKDNIDMFAGNPQAVDPEDSDFQESNMMHSINGYMYGNQPGLEMCTGESIHWHMLGLGSEVDMHGIHFSGNTINVHETRKDVAGLFPHISYSILMEPDNAGVFNVECMTTDHYSGGMRQHYKVNLCEEEEKSCNERKSLIEIITIKTYYIAAEEVEWDYAPNRTWEHEWLSHHTESYGDAFLNKGRTHLGSKYKKAVYREYKDHTFTSRKERKEDEVHLGIQGPLIVATVGERIKIVFKNKASRPYSITAHGIKPEDNNIKATEPGKTETYTWLIPERSGPVRFEGEPCVTWAYYSSVDQIKDTYSGLIGPLVICKKPRLFDLIKDVPKKRFALLFMVFDENESWYLDENIKNYSLHADEVNKGDEEFIESNKMHAINGKMYSNLEGLNMRVGDVVNWHLIGFGNEVDLHTVHFHAHSFKYAMGYNTYQADVYDLYPGAYQTVEMTTNNVGTWMLHCHVADHIHSGMVTVYTVRERKEERRDWESMFQKRT